MITYTAFPSLSPALNDIVESYVVIEGNFPDGFIFNLDLFPILRQYILFNLTEDVQVFTDLQNEHHLKDALVIGQFSTPFKAHLAKRVKIIGVMIKVPALSKLVSVPMHNLSDKSIPLNLLVKSGNELCKTLQDNCPTEKAIRKIEEFLLFQLNSAPVLSEYQRFLTPLSLINTAKGKKTIGELVRETRTSEKTLQRVFLNQLGLTPKLYSGLFKFNEALKYFNVHRTIPANYLEELGYYDQAHFIKDFRRFSQKTPSRFFKDFTHLHGFFLDL